MKYSLTGGFHEAVMLWQEGVGAVLSWEVSRNSGQLAIIRKETSMPYDLPDQ